MNPEPQSTHQVCHWTPTPTRGVKVNPHTTTEHTSHTKFVTARKARLDTDGRTINPGDCVRIISGFSYQPGGPRVGYFKHEFLAFRKGEPRPTNALDAVRLLGCPGTYDVSKAMGITPVSAHRALGVLAERGQIRGRRSAGGKLFWELVR